MSDTAAPCWGEGTDTATVDIRCPNCNVTVPTVILRKRGNLHLRCRICRRPFVVGIEFDGS